MPDRETRCNVSLSRGTTETSFIWKSFAGLVRLRGMNEEKPKTGKNGCLLAGAIGCGALLLIVAIAGVMLSTWFKKAGGMEEAMKSLAQTGGAFVIEKTAENFIGELGLSSEQQKAVMEPIEDFSRKVQKGEISADQAAVLAESLMVSPAAYIIIAEGVFNLYIHPSGLSPEEKDRARKDLHRVQHGLQAQVIVPGDLVALNQYFISEKAPGDTELKASLTDKEVRDCLDFVADVLKKAGVPETVPEAVDLGAVLKSAIEKGLTPPVDSAVRSTN